MKSKTYWVETYRPAFPLKGVYVKVHRTDPSVGDKRNSLSPSLTGLFAVHNAYDATDAKARLIEGLTDRMEAGERIAGAGIARMI